MRLSSRVQPTIRRAITYNKDKLQAAHPAASVSYTAFTTPATHHNRPFLQSPLLFSKSFQSARPSYSSSANSPSSHNPSSPTMDASETKPDNNSKDAQPEPQAPANPPSLPALPAVGDGTSSTLEVGGAALRLDHLGPLVVNEDGTLSRIANWEQMADIERENTLRIRECLLSSLFLSRLPFFSFLPLLYLR